MPAGKKDQKTHCSFTTLRSIFERFLSVNNVKKLTIGVTLAIHLVLLFISAHFMI